jgi:hypothetical protein
VATLDDGFLVLSKIDRLAIHWSRTIEGTPKTIMPPKRPMAGMSPFPAVLRNPAEVLQ